MREQVVSVCERKCRVTNGKGEYGTTLERLNEALSDIGLSCPDTQCLEAVFDSVEITTKMVEIVI